MFLVTSKLQVMNYLEYNNTGNCTDHRVEGQKDFQVLLLPGYLTVTVQLKQISCGNRTDLEEHPSTGSKPVELNSTSFIPISTPKICVESPETPEY